ncbi:hypothetical protein Tco_1191774, partial [Tanacetum coccineum]
MKKGFLNNYNNHEEEEEEEEADEAFGYNLHDLMNDPRSHDPMMRLSRYT